MPMQPMEALIFLVRTLVGLYIIILLLRLLFQAVRADFYNPLSQAIVKMTSPLVMPIRRVVPAMGRIDTACLILACAFQAALIVAVLFLRKVEISALGIGIWTFFGIVHRVIDIFTVALFVIVIVSWVAPQTRNPVVLLANQLTDPLIRPVRRVIPPVGGLDFSVMVVLLLLYMLGAFFIPGAPI